MDVRLVFNGEQLTADLSLSGALLDVDDGLQTAVIASLFTDRRAEPGDVLPDGAGGDRRGWWGDALPPVVSGVPIDGDRIGSRLWLLGREKQLQAVVNRAREYAAEALAWLIEDGIAERVEVEAEIVRAGVLGLDIAIHRPPGDAVDFRFAYAWEGTV